MTQVLLGGNPVHTNADLPKVGDNAPEFELVNNKLETVTSNDFDGKTILLNIFPSIDTPVCSVSTTQFNQRASEVKNTQLITVSADLPFALARFCRAESIDNMMTLSCFRSSFAEDYGVKLIDGPLSGVTARAVVVIKNNKVAYVELVSDIKDEPNYDAAMTALKG